LWEEIKVETSCFHCRYFPYNRISLRLTIELVISQ